MSLRCLCSDTVSNTFPFLESWTCQAVAACPTVAADQSGIFGIRNNSGAAWDRTLPQDLMVREEKMEEHQETVISQKKEQESTLKCRDGNTQTTKVPRIHGFAEYLQSSLYFGSQVNQRKIT